MSGEHRELPPHRLWQPTTAKWFFVIFGFSVAYGVIRYHFAGDVPWRHFPLFILNKATSLAAVIFVACSYLIGKIIRWHDHDKALRLVVIKFCGLMGFFLAAVHAFFSLCLLSPAYYGKYFDEAGRLNLQGEIAMTVGILALFFLGIKGWLAPGDWHGGIPPVSLVAVAAALVPLLVKRKLEHDKKERAAARLDRDSDN